MIYVAVSAKTLHVNVQILAFFQIMKCHNSVTAEWNAKNFEHY